MLGQPCARGLADLDGHLLVIKLGLKFNQEFINHIDNGALVQRAELNDGVQPVAKLGAEGLLDGCHGVRAVVLRREADRGATEALGPGVGGHHDDGIAKIGLAAVGIGQGAMIKDLQQQVKHIRVGLFYFIQQQDTVRLLVDRIGQQAALVKADITRRRADQARDGMPLHILRHIKARQLDAHLQGQLAGDLGLAHPGRPGKQEIADRLVGIAEARARHLDRVGQRAYRLILAEYDQLEIAFQIFEQVFIRGGHGLGRDARYFGDDIFNVTDADRLPSARGRQ